MAGAGIRITVRGSDVVSQRPSVASVVVDGEGVLYDEATQSLHVLDRVGTVVWSCLDGVSPLAEIADDLADVYGAPPAQVRADVRKLIHRLAKLGLVDGVEGAPPPASQPTKPRRRRKYVDVPPNG